MATLNSLTLFGAVSKCKPVILEISSATLTSKPRLVFKPYERAQRVHCQDHTMIYCLFGLTVPTAVPPWASMLNLGITASTRLMPLATC